MSDKQHATLTRCCWEQELLGRRIFRLELGEAAVAPGRLPEPEADWDMIECEIDVARQDQVNALMQSGFELVETRIDLETRADDHRPVPVGEVIAGLQIRRAARDDLGGLIGLVQNLFVFSRFYRPPFEREDGNRVFAAWTRNAIAGTFDDVCLMAESENEPVGFVTLRREHDSAQRIGIMGTAEAWRSRGIGSGLLAAARSYARENGQEKLYVATQLANARALRFYHVNGFVIRQAALRLHKSPCKTSDQVLAI